MSRSVDRDVHSLPIPWDNISEGNACKTCKVLYLSTLSTVAAITKSGGEHDDSVPQ